MDKEKNKAKFINSIITYSVALILLLFDQITKYIISSTYELGMSKPIIEPFIYFTYVRNDGAAFSIFKGQVVWLSIIAIVIIIGLIIYEQRLPYNRSKLLTYSLGFILGGAMGNLLDRLRFGSVVDFIDLHYNGQNIWPIFNVADIVINIGIGLLFIYYIIESINEKKSKNFNRTRS